MKLPFGKPGVSRFIFVALLLVFNWPILSIPRPENLFGWLFAAWAVAIGLLFLAACAGNNSGDSDKPTGADKPGGPGGGADV